MRQAMMKNSDSNSWIIHIKKILDKFELNSAHSLILNPPPSKDSWKKLVKGTVNEYYLKRLIEEALPQSSGRYLLFYNCHLSMTHNLWKSVNPSSRDVTRAMVKAKLLTATYNLQCRRQYFGKGASGLCPMCKSGVETRDHFIATCSALGDVRDQYVPKLRSLLLHDLSQKDTNAILAKPRAFTQAILDPSFCCGQETIADFEFHTRRLCYALHSKRTALLKPDQHPGTTRTSTSAAVIPPNCPIFVHFSQVYHHRCEC